MHIFDQDMELKETGDHRLRAEISDSWSHIGNLNGGFLLGLAGKAASMYSDKNGSLLITANYLNRTLPGKIDIEVEELSKSGNFERFEVTLIQDNSKVLRAFCTLSAKTGETEDLSGLYDYKPSVSEADCVPVDRPGTTSLYESVDVRIDPATSGWMKGKLEKPGRIRGWVRFKEPREFDLFAAAIATDCFPPSVFSALGASAWVPTLELTVHITRNPAADALWSDFKTNYITDGIVIEEGIVTDPDGEIVAICRQSAVYRPER